MRCTYATHAIVRWDKREKALVFGGPRKEDGMLLHVAFNHTPIAADEPSLLSELEKRGYDLSTLKFSVERTGRP